MISNNLTPVENAKPLEKAPLLEKETRFAVVMYGGISLAIYIHGVAQELYHMVRATARHAEDERYYRFRDDELSEVEKIYRCLGKSINTKFVVDILSGTSAGGINAVFLAKALVNDRPMEFVKNFWVDQGDISKLINDKESMNGLDGLLLQSPPAGLLNSQRFYYKILEALQEMGSSSQDFHSPFVEELDLNITTTDISGLNLPIQISNAKVIEPRYKNVFKFYYKKKTKQPGNDRNDFSMDIDPFLAFAARCTASIPPAFEAMQLKDIEPILKTAIFRKSYGGFSVDNKNWKLFYQDYLNEDHDFSVRSFGDGGYLDNKPFSHATEALLRRTANFPVDRQLIYIEPTPEHAEKKTYLSERPDMVKNILAALVQLPRQETIRDDLKILEERNSIVRKINQILSNSYHTVELRSAPPSWAKSNEWVGKYLMDDDVLNWYGGGYITYHQLRVESVMQNLTTAFTRAIGWNEGGAEERALHEMLHAWLDAKYSISKPDNGAPKYSQNDILFRLDLSFRIRKYHFLQHILNIILQNLREYLQGRASGAEIDKIFRASGLSFPSGISFDENIIRQCVQLLQGLKRDINDIYNYARDQAVSLRKRRLIAKDNNADDELKAYKSKLKDLKELLLSKKSKISEKKPECVILLEELSETLGTHLSDPASDVEKKSGGYLYDTFNELSKKGWEFGIKRNAAGVVENLLTADGLLVKAALAGIDNMDAESLNACLNVYCHVQKCLAFYYENFEYYDMLTFAIQYGTDAGESDEVEIIRISPEDATNLVNERKSGKEKLAGTKLANFGAFFNKEWRENDMLWGRLDTSEILITQMLRSGLNMEDDKDKKVYNKRLEDFITNLADSDCEEEADTIKLTLTAILEDDFRPKLDSAIVKVISGGEKWLANTAKKGKLLSLLRRVSDAIKLMTGNRKIYNYFKKNYSVDQNFPPETLKAASRASMVTGDLLKDLSGEYKFLSNAKGLIVTISRVTAGVLLAAQGGSIANGLAVVFYLSGILLILAGKLIPGLNDALVVGLLTMVFTLVIHVSALRTRSTFTGEQNWLGRVLAVVISVFWGVIKAALLAAFLFLLYLGAVYLGAPMPGKWFEALVAVVKGWVMYLQQNKLAG